MSMLLQSLVLLPLAFPARSYVTQKGVLVRWRRRLSSTKSFESFSALEPFWEVGRGCFCP